MHLIHPEILPQTFPCMGEIEENIKAIYRAIVFSPAIQADTLLHRYMEATGHLRHVLGYKNAQQEAQTEEEAREYLTNLEKAMAMVMDEIRCGHCIAGPVDLFRLFRVVSPETAARHTNHYRQTLVQVGGHLAPEPRRLEGLVDALFWHLPQISHPLMRAIWLHHELVRIHPFADGNGRVGRMAKNWILMYELYPPIFIYGLTDRQNYIQHLSASFSDLEREPDRFHESTRSFFEDELLRMKTSTRFLLDRIEKNATAPFGPEDEDMRPYTKETNTL